MDQRIEQALKTSRSDQVSPHPSFRVAFKVVYMPPEFDESASSGGPKVYTSLWAPEPARVYYIPGEWAEPPEHLLNAGYGLFVFSNTYDLAPFLYGQIHNALPNPGYSVWEVAVRGRMPLPPKLLTYEDLQCERLPLEQ